MNFLRSRGIRSFSSTRYVRGRPRTIQELPEKVQVEVSAMGRYNPLPLSADSDINSSDRFANLVPARRGKDICQRVGSTYGFVSD